MPNFSKSEVVLVRYPFADLLMMPISWIGSLRRWSMKFRGEKIGLLLWTGQ